MSTVYATSHMHYDYSHMQYRSQSDLPLADLTCFPPSEIENIVIPHPVRGSDYVVLGKTLLHILREKYDTGRAATYGPPRPLGPVFYIT